MRWVLLAVALFTATFVGCGLLESAFGVRTDPVTGETTSDGTGGVVGQVGGSIFPWLAPIIPALAAAYCEIKRRQTKKALVASFEAVEAEAEAHPESGIKQRLAGCHTAAGVYSFVSSILDKEGINKPDTATAGG